MADGSTRNFRPSAVHATSQDATTFTRNLAVIIGINEYANGIPRLQTAGNDAARLTEILLETFGYDVMLLADIDIAQRLEDHFTQSPHSPASAATDETTTTAQLTYLGPATLNALRTLLAETLPAQLAADDRVLFYFAGHGVTLEGIEVEEGPVGYLIPQDAHANDRDTFWAMTEFYEQLTKLSCRHMLVILDCCFAGALRWVTTRNLQIPPQKIYRERYELFIKSKAWQAITSAAYDQKALDILSGSAIGARGEGVDAAHSPFALALFDALAGAGDTFPPGENGKAPGDGLLTASELYQYLRDNVELKAKVQANHPQSPGLWPLKHHHAGEYVFLMPHRQLELEKAPSLTFALNPYRGLNSFEEADHDLFFGRQALVEQLAERVEAQPLTVVSGASGTGKSSVVKAGVLPYLRGKTPPQPSPPSTSSGTKGGGRELVAESLVLSQHEGGTKDWQILPTMRPTEAPLAALEECLKTLSAEPASVIADRWQPSTAEIHVNSRASALQTITTWCKAHPNHHLLLVIDQFEELVTLCTEQQRAGFLDLLRDLLQTHREQLHIVLTLRSDFEPQFSTALLPKAEWMTARVTIPAMSQAELREAIVKPAEARVLYFDPPELVDMLIEEVNNMPGALPLLSFTLSEMYIKYIEELAAGKTTDRALTAAYHQELGGVIGSLSKRATGIYTGFDEAHQATMRRVMLRMVAVEGGELARRRVPLTELIYPSAEENARVATVTERLITARLLVMDSADGDGDGVADAHIEPAHDALVRAWDLLLQWKQRFEEYLSLQRTLTNAANEWTRTGSELHSGLLWNNNPRLPQLQAILSPVVHEDDQHNHFLHTAKESLWPHTKMTDEPTWLNQRETAFVRASVVRRAKVLKQIVLITLAVVVALGALTLVAFDQQQQAQTNAAAEAVARAAAETEEANAVRAAETAVAAEATAEAEAFHARRSLSTQRALQSDADRDLWPQRSLLMAIEALRVTQDQGEPPVPEAEDALRNSLSVVEGRTLTPFEGNVCTLAVSPDGTHLVLSDCDNGLTAQLWNFAMETPQMIPLFGSDGMAFPVRRTADVVAQSAPDEVALTVFNGMGRFSTDNRWFVMPDYREPVQVEGGSAFLIWDFVADRDVAGFDVLMSPPNFYTDVYERLSATILNNSRMMIAGGHDGKLAIWNLEEKEQPATVVQLAGIEGEILALEVSSNDEWLALVAEDVPGYRGQTVTRSVYGVAVTDLLAANAVTPHRLADGQAFSAAGSVPDLPHFIFSPVANRLFTGIDLGKVEEWTLEESELSGNLLWETDLPITQLAIDATGRWLYAAATNGERNAANLWRLDGTEPQRFLMPTIAGSIQVARFHPSRSLLAYSDDEQTYIIDLVDGYEETNVQPVLNSVADLRFSRDGSTLIGDGGYHVIVWNQTELGQYDRSRLLAGQQTGGQYLALDSTGERIVAITDNTQSTSRIWDLAQLANDSHRILLGSARAVTVSNDERWLLAVLDNELVVWDLQTNGVLPARHRLLEDVAMSGEVTLTMSPAQNFIAIGDQNGQVRRWRFDHDAVALMDEFARLQAPFPVSHLRIGPQGHLLYAGSIEYLDEYSAGIITVWNLATGTDSPSFLRGEPGRTLAMELSPDGQWLGALSGGELLNLWELPLDPIDPISPTEALLIAAEDFAFSPNGHQLAVGGDRTIRLYDLERLANEPSGRVDDTQGILLVDGKAGYAEVAYPRDSSYLYGIPDRLNVARWSVTDGQPTRLTDLSGENTTLRWLYAGRWSDWVVAANLDGPYRLWNLANGEDAPFARHIGIGGLGRPFVVDPNGRWLITLDQSATYADDRGTLYLWHLRLEQLLAMACEKVGRNFNESEWRALFGQAEYRKTCKY